jgi:hypothetical protein
MLSCAQPMLTRISYVFQMLVDRWLESDVYDSVNLFSCQRTAGECNPLAYPVVLDVQGVAKQLSSIQFGNVDLDSKEPRHEGRITMRMQVVRYATICVGLTGI